MTQDAPTTRRALLTRMGLAAGLAYAAPTLIGTGTARASDGSGSSGRGSGQGSGRGSDRGSGRGFGRGSGRASVSRPVRQRQARPRPRPEMVVILAPGQSVQPLQAAGYDVLSQRDNATLSRSAARLRLPPGRNAAQAREEIARLLPGSLAALNSLYRPDDLTCDGADCAAQKMVSWTPADLQARPRIGMIDTGVNPDHPSLRGQSLRVNQVDLDGRNAAGRRHGTAVAALLIGNPQGRAPGLLPRADLIAVEAFHSRADGAAADAFSLLNALDVLIQARVQVINMSFSGPANPVLRQIVIQARDAGIGLVAAAGNGGPGAAPAFPAAWPEVIAVTAVDADRAPYRQAAQGPHVALAAPGVNLWTAASIEGGRLRSGTSYAAPFVSAALALGMARDGLNAADARDRLFRCATDLGAPGRDPVFGHGMVASPSACADDGSQLFSVSGE